MSGTAEQNGSSRSGAAQRRRVLILGAAGRDFHNFNVLYRDDPTCEVVGFTAQQIPNIAGRTYPAVLAGRRYPNGIPIFPESDLERLIHDRAVDCCVMSYSDVSHVEVMHLASRANAAGAEFRLPGAMQTMLHSVRPVIAVCASRTGAGKSQTTRALVKILRAAGKQPAVLRHPMPYGDLELQRAQRFANRGDLERHRVTIEEREEYEPHIDAGTVVFAGVDYASILEQAETAGDVLVWDGGNNDTSFLVADLYITVVDPLRAGDELSYHPGETNVRLADVIIINKVDTASPDAVDQVERNVRWVNPSATVLRCASTIRADDPSVLAGRRVLAIEDGPTLTHGGMAFGAAAVGAERAGAAALVDPRPYAAGSIADVYRAYPGVGAVLPAMGYGEAQIRHLEATIAAAVMGGVESIAVGTPIDLGALIDLPVPWTRVRYELEPDGQLEALLRPFLARFEERRGGGTVEIPAV